MDINSTFETSTTSVGLVSIDPGFVEKQDVTLLKKDESLISPNKNL